MFLSFRQTHWQTEKRKKTATQHIPENRRTLFFSRMPLHWMTKHNSSKRNSQKECLQETYTDHRFIPIFVHIFFSLGLVFFNTDRFVRNQSYSTKLKLFWCCQQTHRKEWTKKKHFPSCILNIDRIAFDFCLKSEVNWL